MLLGRSGGRLRPLCVISPSSSTSLQNVLLGGSHAFLRQNSNWRRSNEPPRDDLRSRTLAIISGAALIGAGVWTWKHSGQALQAASLPLEEDTPQTVIKRLPFYTAAQVAEHYDAGRRVWVSFGRGVYDVTEFVAQHPGGDKIMMGAGGSIEPFWELYPVHQSPHVFSILARLRVGNLAEEDVVKGDSGSDLFGKEPRRHPTLIPRSARPFNGETPPSLLTLNFYTPNELFYVRNHLPVPQVDVESYELEVEGLHLSRPRSFCLKDLQAFPKTSIAASIQCGGNRRADMGVDQPVAGLAWTGGAIGTAKWTGVRLRDVLEATGFDPSAYKNPEKFHVQFEGLDSDASGESYGASVPLSYILDRNFEPLLAYEMNEKVLPVDHGFPVRIILPGIVGARSVKWLGRIRITEEESNSPWQQRDYKVFSPGVRMETADFSSVPAIMDTPVTSYIASHTDGQEISDRHQLLQGYAFSGGGRDIVRVEVSTDKGQTWKVANLTGKKKEGCRNWAWVLWELQLDLGTGSQEVWVKAVDSGYNQQPESFNGIWNYRGLLATAYHKIHLKCPNK